MSCVRRLCRGSHIAEVWPGAFCLVCGPNPCRSCAPALKAVARPVRRRPAVPRVGGLPTTCAGHVSRAGASRQGRSREGDRGTLMGHTTRAPWLDLGPYGPRRAERLQRPATSPKLPAKNQSRRPGTPSPTAQNAGGRDGKAGELRRSCAAIVNSPGRGITMFRRSVVPRRRNEPNTRFSVRLLYPTDLTWAAGNGDYNRADGGYGTGRGWGESCKARPNPRPAGA